MLICSLWFFCCFLKFLWPTFSTWFARPLAKWIGLLRWRSRRPGWSWRSRAGHAEAERKQSRKRPEGLWSGCWWQWTAMQDAEAEGATATGMSSTWYMVWWCLMVTEKSTKGPRLRNVETKWPHQSRRPWGRWLQGVWWCVAARQRNLHFEALKSWGWGVGKAFPSQPGSPRTQWCNICGLGSRDVQRLKDEWRPFGENLEDTWGCQPK